MGKRCLLSLGNAIDADWNLQIWRKALNLRTELVVYGGLMKQLILICLLSFSPALYVVPAAVAAETTEAKSVLTEPVENTSTVPDAGHGKQIFKTICSHCHHTDHSTSAVGAPGLMDVLERHDEAWIDQWIHDPEGFSKKDETAKALVESNPFGLIMPTLPETKSAENRRDIIAFLKTLKSE